MATYKSHPLESELGALIDEASFYDVNGKKVKALLHDNYLRLVWEKKLMVSVQRKAAKDKHKDKDKDKAKDKSKDKDKVRYFPLALLYIDRRGDVPVNEKEKEKERGEQGEAPLSPSSSAAQLPKLGELNIKGKLVSGFTLIGPEGSLVLGTSDKAVRKAFLDVLAREVKKSKRSLENDGYFTAIDLSQSRVSVTDLVTSKNEDIRKGKFVFAHGGWYEGEWFQGKPHGEGVYDKDEKRFEGWWNAHLAAGYGYCYTKDKSGSWKKQRGGWKVHLTESPGATYVEPEPELDAKTESGLLPGDIALILKHGEIKEYEPGETVLQEGQANRNLYWIRAGSIAITKFDESTQKSKQIATLGANRFFGELSVLDKSVISATVVAATKLTLTILPLPVLLNLFEASPGLSKRFLKKIATGLAEKVRSTNATIKPARPLNASNAQNKWALARKVVNFSGMLMNLALQESAQMALTEENEADDSPTLKLARRFLALWSQGRHADLMKLVSREVIYLDPYANEGIKGASELAKHLQKLMDTHKEWRWQVMEFLPHKSKNKFSMRVRLLVPERRLRVWGMLMGAVKHDKFTQLELFYDRTPLDPEKPAPHASVPHQALSPRAAGESVEGAPTSSFGSEKDMEFRQRFALRSLDATIIQEFDCDLSIAGLMDKHPGQLYVSQEVLCFGSRVFGLDMKKVIPLVTLDAVERADLRLTLVSRPPAAKEVTYVLVFSDLVQTESAHQLIGAVVSAAKEQAKEDDADAPHTNESYMERHLREQQLHRSVKEVRLAMAKGDKAARIEGPRASDTHSAYEDDVVGRAISNYPLKATVVDGKVVVDPNAREGDPICDQFVVDRFPNQTEKRVTT